MHWKTQSNKKRPLVSQLVLGGVRYWVDPDGSTFTLNENGHLEFVGTWIR